MKMITKTFLTPMVLALTAGLFIGSSSAFAGSSKVRIFVPTPNPVKKVKKVKKAPTPQPQPVIVQQVFYLPYYTRSQRFKLFNGPRYPGFVQQYRGPKYPF